MVRRRVLTDRMIAKLKPGAKRLTLPDPELRGHYIRVTPTGAKSYVAVAQVMTGLIVGHFAPGDGGAPELAYRLVFAYLAAAMVLALLFYARVRDSRPSED